MNPINIALNGLFDRGVLRSLGGNRAKLEHVGPKDLRRL